MEAVVNELNDILKPSWGSEKWIAEGWEKLNHAEKKLIRQRIDTLFENGLPFQLKHDKIFYIYTFSLLAQLEVLAIQIPLKFSDKMTSPKHRETMHSQFLDEIFHGLVFTKIVYLLCQPYALPPAYCEDIEILCDFIRGQACPKTAVVLLNLIGEGWIEEMFTCLAQHDIAPTVFATILEDERRHVSEADLYRDIGLPAMEEVSGKLEALEELLLTRILGQYKYVVSLSTLLGTQGIATFMQALNQKHEQQLQKLGLKPGEKWQNFTRFGFNILPALQQYSSRHQELELTPLRKVLMTQWSRPSDPTMVGQFELDVSCLDLFGKKYPSSALTTLMLQTVSQSLMAEDVFRSFLSHNTLYQSEEAYTALVVKLPNCQDHIGTIIFANCHQDSYQALTTRTRQILRLMVYCYKKREKLERKYPYLKDIFADFLYDLHNNTYPYPMPGTPFVSLSNIGFCGYSQAKSPLRVNEALKFTLLEVARRPVWNQNNHQFEPCDMLPVSISADHRIFDGNLPIPKLIAANFQHVFQRMSNLNEKPAPSYGKAHELLTVLDQLLRTDIETGYKILTFLQTVWPDFMSIETLCEQAANSPLAKKFNFNPVMDDISI